MHGEFSGVRGGDVLGLPEVQLTLGGEVVDFELERSADTEPSDGIGMTVDGKGVEEKSHFGKISASGFIVLLRIFI